MALLLLLCLQQTVEMKDHGSSYLLRLPPGYDGSSPVPAVVHLHGRGRGEGASDASARWAATADARGFVVIVPDAAGRAWSPARAAFVRACLDDAKTRAWIDPSRVLLTGHGEGAGLAVQAAGAMSDVFAGCAPFGLSGRPEVGGGPPICFVVGSEDPEREKVVELAAALVKAGRDVRAHIVMGTGREEPPAAARERVLGWFEERVPSRMEMSRVDLFMKAGRYLDASLVLMALMDRAGVAREVRWELQRIQSHGLFELGKVEIARTERRYVDAYVRCRRAATDCAWLPVGDALRKKLEQLGADPKVRKALERDE